MSIAADPAGRGITVTIKHGKGYQDTWSVFKGLPHEVREDIMSYFDLGQSEVEGLSLHHLVVHATTVAHATGNIAGLMGGQLISTGPAPAAAPRRTGAGDDPWIDAGNAAPAKPAENPLLGLIKEAATVKDLQRLWAENQEAFKETAIMDAWKARGRELS